MRTRTEPSDSAIAVHAEDSITCGETVVSKPFVNTFPINSTAMDTATSIHMVNREKFEMGFTTAYTQRTTVGSKRSSLEGFLAGFSLRPEFFLVLLSPRSPYFLVTLLVGSRIRLVVGTALLLMSLVIRKASLTISMVVCKASSPCIGTCFWRVFIFTELSPLGLDKLWLWEYPICVANR